jgi:hypothetical protein
MNEDWVPTARLRFVVRAAPPLGDMPVNERVLQVWYSQDVPGYMRRDAEGEWRDVSVEEETAP